MKAVIIISILILLTACGSSSSDENIVGEIENTPSVITISSGDSVVANLVEDSGVVTGNLSIAGKITIVDIDGDGAFSTNVNFTSSTSTGGIQLGTLTIDSLGNWSYSVDNSNALLQNLHSIDSIVEVFEVSTIDGNDTQAITITISGVNDTPFIVIPNNGEALANTDIVVDENLTITGSFTIEIADLALRATGTAFSILNTGGSIRNFSLAELTDLSTTNQLINTAVGVLALVNFDTSTMIVDYTYNPHTTGTDHFGGPLSVIDQYTMVATDSGDNNSPPAILDILIADTDPIAVDDVRDIFEGTFAIGGNAVGMIGSGFGDALDTINGSPLTPAIGITHGSIPAVGGIGSPVVGDYGSLLMSNNGVYTYTLDNMNSEVIALNNDETLTDVFTYTITDGDGENGSGTLTIIINGITL